MLEVALSYMTWKAGNLEGSEMRVAGCWLQLSLISFLYAIVRSTIILIELVVQSSKTYFS